MPVTITIDGIDVYVQAVSLTRDNFAPFGEVIENPRPDIHPSQFFSVSARDPLPFDPVPANQGSAIKYQHVGRPLDLYGQAPSRKPGVAVMNMFVSATRCLGSTPHSRHRRPSSSAGDRCFAVEILERHPFTSQTFIPLSSAPSMRYLVIVAPSLAPSEADSGLPVPDSAQSSSPSSSSPGTAPYPWRLPGRGLPDLRGLWAFVATGRQAVTYGAGTWHAPMVAFGDQGAAVDFLVTQFANGVGIEDCQEAVFEASTSAEAGRWGVTVEVLQVPRAARL